MPGRIWSSEEKYNIIMESFNNPNITIAEICRNHGIAASIHTDSYLKHLIIFCHEIKRGYLG